MRRLTVALAASVLVWPPWPASAELSAEAGSARLSRRPRRHAAVADAERLRGQAQSSLSGDPTKWSEARGRGPDVPAIARPGRGRRGASDRREGCPGRPGARSICRGPETGRRARADRTLLARLETIRANRSEHWNPKRTDADYAEPSANSGSTRIDSTPRRPGTDRAAVGPGGIGLYLDDWAVQRRKARASERRRLAWSSRPAADPHPMRAWPCGSDRRATTWRHSACLADDRKELEAESSTSLVLLAVALIGRGDHELPQTRVLRTAKANPGDFWVNHELGEVYRSRTTTPIRKTPSDSARPPWRSGPEVSPPT